MSKKVELVFSGLYVFFECMFTFYPVGLTEKRFFSEQDTPSPFPRFLSTRRGQRSFLF